MVVSNLILVLKKPDHVSTGHNISFCCSFFFPEPCSSTRSLVPFTRATHFGVTAFLSHRQPSIPESVSALSTWLCLTSRPHHPGSVRRLGPSWPRSGAQPLRLMAQEKTQQDQNVWVPPPPQKTKRPKEKEGEPT